MKEIIGLTTFQYAVLRFVLRQFATEHYASITISVCLSYNKTEI